jgi:hypothetical protein
VALSRSHDLSVLAVLHTDLCGTVVLKVTPAQAVPALPSGAPSIMRTRRQANRTAPPAPHARRHKEDALGHRRKAARQHGRGRVQAVARYALHECQQRSGKQPFRRGPCVAAPGHERLFKHTGSNSHFRLILNAQVWTPVQPALLRSKRRIDRPRPSHAEAARRLRRQTRLVDRAQPRLVLQHSDYGLAGRNDARAERMTLAPGLRWSFSQCRL